MATNQLSKIVEMAGEAKVGVEKEPDEWIRWKNMCLEEETHVEAEKRFGEVEEGSEESYNRHADERDGIEGLNVSFLMNDNVWRWRFVGTWLGSLRAETDIR
ncbi:hypothetical protein BT96DRAFT_1007486 [Gymnopus androsaceus JB14]|uniref:Uncharacterized protein n=1 Tax=Gymnopus androsaceus JB14 TaxID=1447944 RepID=A0A6A4GHQ0_9AGAR|nr:hypothetical protein BT96DRAFT_1007486 [Gymnopus androsaceus JB14]